VRVMAGKSASVSSGQLEALAQASLALTAELSLERVLQKIAEVARDVLQAKYAALGVINESGTGLSQFLTAGIDEAAKTAIGPLPTGKGVLGLLIREGRPIRTGRLSAHPQSVGFPKNHPPMDSFLGVPITVRDKVYGNLYVTEKQGAEEFSEADERVALMLAAQAGIAIENAQLLHELTLRQTLLEAVLQASRQLARIQPVESLFRGIAESCRALLQADWVWFRVLDGEELVLSASAGDAFEGIQIERLPRGRGLSWIVAVSGEPLMVRNPGEDPRTIPEWREGLRKYRAWLGVPLKVGEQVVGVLNMGTRRDAGFSAADLAIAVAFAAQGSVGFENSRLYREIQWAFEELTQTQDQLVQAQKMEAIGQLAGGIAHDFNNLLTVITGRSHLALRDLPTDHPHWRTFELIQKTAERAAALTRHLLAFSRQQVLQPRLLDLNAVVSGVAPMLQRLIGEDIEFVAVAAPDLGRVKADPSQIEQVIMNLAVNARDAMPQGGRLTIETANTEVDEGYARRHVGVPPGRYVLLAVSDTGHGMDAATQARIFEPFFTTKEKGKGTGLGLATVYGVVQQSGGHIWVYSEPGQGATFKLYLPRVDEAVETEAAGPPAMVGERGSETILLVEDDEEVRAVARETLEAAGYVVLPAANATEALGLTADGSPRIQLLVTDVVMPQVSGRELAERLAPTYQNLRVLYISGYTDDAIVRHGIVAKGTAFLQKPFTPGTLLRKVREVLDGPR
jgi:signal transduction histidine kinase